MFGTPFFKVNVTAWRAAKGNVSLDHRSLVDLAYKGYIEANAQGPFIDPEHGQLTPNNAFFEYQMAMLNEATLHEQRTSHVGWPELAELDAWESLVTSLHEVRLP